MNFALSHLREETAPSFTGELRFGIRIFSFILRKGCFGSLGISWPGKWWSHCLWKHPRGVWMWDLGIWFRGDYGSAAFMGGQMILKVSSNLSDSVT